MAKFMHKPYKIRWKKICYIFNGLCKQYYQTLWLNIILIDGQIHAYNSNGLAKKDLLYPARAEGSCDMQLKNSYLMPRKCCISNNRVKFEGV